MASPLNARKQSVDMAAPVVRVSRIRRDPPATTKELSAADIREHDARNVVIGTIAMALAVFVILIGVTSAAGWSLGHYTIDINQSS